ncbi:MAG: valine--tRNA ligase [Candidatus Bathyarchaeota archaeon]|nr:MAG: valine--tRNA ligase [Candidatus Bathyarchaeota archaeon]
MDTLPKKIDFLAVEKKWQRKWEEWGIYHFDRVDNSRPVYCIDTPPPYPSGEFHMGNVLNWTYFDVVARFKRMQGFNVFFPQGWDCHGLQIERRAEKEFDVEKSEIPTAQFIALCRKFVDKYINIMKTAIKRLGCSTDWTTEYKTMNPDYWRRTQLSFILLHEKGYIYQGTHPVNWCTDCQTAIADAEVNYEPKRGSLYHISFSLKDGDPLVIATTRPELIPACVTVAINPEDKRYKKHLGKEIKVPTTSRTVKIIADNMVDPEFGTGVVMICTYGDKADVKTVAKYRLPSIEVLTKDGKMNHNSGEYQGLTVEEARRSIVTDLKERLLKVEKIQQEIGLCDRCNTPIEILETKQFFMKTRTLTDLVEKTANSLTWYPGYMKTRLIDWAKSLDWDWVISRQRVFGTPIPIWYCAKCQVKILAERSWLPIDPKLHPPQIDKCPECGHSTFIPERDVFDTWMDSSITCAVHSGWPDKPEKELKRLFPADLHPSGTDIIRTWAYYLMVRHLALFDETPYKACLINGMVLGRDGRKMSKSLGNYVATSDVFDKYGSDTSRQWATGGGTTGSDIPFRWPDVEYAWRFLRKIWNASRFVSLVLEDYSPESTPELPLLDKWLLEKVKKTTVKVTRAFERCQFNIAVEEARNFAWHELCDEYLEAVKHRLYRSEIYGEAKRRAAQHTLYTALYGFLQLFAPIAPHITEEIYQCVFADHLQHQSIHTSPWPDVNEDDIDETIIENGDLLVAVIGEVRREKARRKMPLNAAIEELTIYTGDAKIADSLLSSLDTIKGTCKVDTLNVSPESGEGTGVQRHPSIKLTGF